MDELVDVTYAKRKLGNFDVQVIAHIGSRSNLEILLEPLKVDFGLAVPNLLLVLLVLLLQLLLCKCRLVNLSVRPDPHDFTEVVKIVAKGRLLEDLVDVHPLGVVHLHQVLLSLLRLPRDFTIRRHLGVSCCWPFEKTAE